MSKDDDISDLNEHWEDDAEDSNDAEPEVEKVKPVENKDARRRLDDLLEMTRVKRLIEDDF
ncbi:MAG: hypothetical protein B7X35_00090 [Halothiobacillus sp. 14-56-357]|uniref:PA3496 family putative envelope integrity protein n=1 Tax=Halothiobacillus sp. 15-55-196 TaxID=1970382 RepID=UPI000BCE3160|nr:hypothetical protein [Halothiobacillus sp. 15-55-196]OZB37485.1 MAG: hypothetical protein B7X44_01480 [Halothiobacillus sp. 15-55-196]OZB57700.1 MAG: hypothetical protein B7X35_00090 [Halothiobacillus sp. 14-56-357]OZB79525.1 MAG: hypothetical protein B7X29_00380 [Halothiobacillus sp. 13-55-115]